MNYIEFASKISFFEFLQDEFKPPHFNVDKYKEEIGFLNRDVNVEYIIDILGSNPKVIDIFEELLQLKRFTNTQYINFCFDVNTLNNAEESLVLRYVNEGIFKFENGIYNDDFAHIYKELSGEQTFEGKERIFYTKRTIVRYVNKVVQRKGILYNHLKNSIGARFRVARYLIENLYADDLLSAVKLEMFLRQKRHPVDTKGLHGKFGTLKITKIFKNNKIRDVSSAVRETTVSPTETLIGDFRGGPMLRKKRLRA
jgi:hypothetical protein